MDPRDLYTLRYRSGSHGVDTVYITASTKEKALEVGQWYCNQQPNRRFIRVESAVVADEKDLPAAEPVAEKPAKKSAAA